MLIFWSRPIEAILFKEAMSHILSLLGLHCTSNINEDFITVFHGFYQDEHT